MLAQGQLHFVLAAKEKMYKKYSKFLAPLFWRRNFGYPALFTHRAARILVPMHGTIRSTTCVPLDGVLTVLAGWTVYSRTKNRRYELTVFVGNLCLHEVIKPKHFCGDTPPYQGRQRGSLFFNPLPLTENATFAVTCVPDPPDSPDSPDAPDAPDTPDARAYVVLTFLFIIVPPGCTYEINYRAMGAAHIMPLLSHGDPQ